MLQFIRGNLLAAEVEALVNTVNCIGYMGKGIAAQFKHQFPENFRAYHKACKAGKVKPGNIFVFETGLFSNPKFILNFPTKRHWRERSRIEDIKSGLEALIPLLKKLKIKSIAIPALGCGLGGLPWDAIQGLIKNHFIGLDDMNVLIFEPEMQQGQPYNTTLRPKMTRSRALFIKLIEHYKKDAYRLSLLEIQKLAYFLQEAGESLKLKYEAGHYGPYAHNLNKVLEALENHYITGYTNSALKPSATIELLNHAIQEANIFLVDDLEAQERLAIVEDLIEGFETPYGLELLGTVHWVADNEPRATNPQSAIERIHAWNLQKKEKFNTEHIISAWEYLKKKSWIK